jgi:hypothetical protein
LLDGAGALSISHNWFKPNWRSTHGTLTGTVNNNGASIQGASPGFVNEAAQDFRLLSNSAAVNAGTNLNPAVLPAHNVVRQYFKHQTGEPRPVSGALDLGAYEFGAVAPAPVQITTTSLPDGRRGRTYNQTLQATGGSGNYVWSISAGSLPTGLMLETATGRIYGKLPVRGVWNFTATVQDAQNSSAAASKNFTITVR